MGSSTNQTAQAALDQKNAEIEWLRRLLTGACRSIMRLTTGLPIDEQSKAWGPEVLAWWQEQDEYTDEQARRVLLSLPDAEVEVLSKYLERHGKLPE